MHRVAALLCLFLTLPAAAFVYETPHEFSGAGDFDGDGREDIVVVDKASGNYRIGYQLGPESYTWASTRGSGIEGVTGFSAGKLVATTRDALVFTGPDANRINVLEAQNPNSGGFPRAVFCEAAGPSLAIALDVGGVGNTAHDDLLVGSIYGNASPHRIQPMRNNAGVFTTLPFTALPDRADAGNRVTLKTGVPAMAGLLLRGSTDTTFRAYGLDSGSVIQEIELTGLPAAVQYVHGRFSGGPFAQFLFYQAGESDGSFRVHSVEEPSPSDFAFGAGVQFSFGTAIKQLVVLPPNRLLVIFGNGEAAGAYEFDGVNPPTFVQEFAAPAGEHFSGAAALSNGNTTLFSAAQGATSSTRFQNFQFDGNQYLAGQSGALPGLTVLSSLANVFQFENEPFVSTTPNLLSSLNAGDWTSVFNNQALPQLSLTIENFVSSSNGLDNPTPLNAGTSHPLTHFGLVNQYAAPLSLFSLSRPIGDEVVEVKIAPPGGTYPSSVTVSLTATTPGASITYRLNPTGVWTPYTSPFTVFHETTVSYYAQAGGSNRKSTIRHATYKFTEPAGELDSDGDGVPDYVEIAKGLNPKGGPDSDGDGYSDLEELLRGTNASNPNDAPTNYARLELKSSFDVIQTPRPLDGIANVLSTSQTDTAVRAYDLPGALLRFGVTANLNQPGVMDSAAKLSNIIVNTKQRMLTVATEQHFDIVTAHTNPTLGRELIALLPVPEIAQELVVPYNYSGGNLNTEADNWINAAKAAQSNLTHEVIIGQLDMNDTLAALLVEKKISELLLSRGYSLASNLTLFPFRPTDVSRNAVAQDQLLALESMGPNSEPAYQLRTMHGAIQNLVFPATPFNAPLRGVTAEIYRISSALSDIEPGKYPLPVDVLREYLWTGVLHTNYLAQTTLTQSDLSLAYTRAGQLLAAVANRPTTNITLAVRSDTFTGDCTLLDTYLGNGVKSLFHPTGQPYRLLENFTLPPGSQIQVFGFTDIGNHGCTGDAIEVIALGLGSVPAVTSVDTDGDLLLDELEWLLFAGLDQNGTGDADDDGISNLQEMFDGTDPQNALSHASNAADMAPNLVLNAGLGNQWNLTWDWPEAYANKVEFSLFAMPAVGQPWVQVPLAPVNVGSGQWQATIQVPGGLAQFYRLQLSLK